MIETNANSKSIPLKKYTLTNLMEEMIYRLPGCAEIMMRKELQHTLIEFCTLTGALKLYIPITYKENADCYPLVAPNDYSIMQVNSFTTTWGSYKNSKEFAITKDLCNHYISFNIKPGAYDQTEVSSLQYVVECVCVPGVQSEDVPEDFLKRYGMGIVSGAMAKLMSMSGKAWSDVGQSSIKNFEYQNALNDARIDLATHGKQQITYGRDMYTSWF